MKKLFILIFLYSSQIFAQYITINEFMSKNGNSIVDEDNEYNDWIELHNNHSDTISLKIIAYQTMKMIQTNGNCQI